MENFSKIKKKIAKNAFLRSSLIGGGVGVLVASGAALICKLLGMKVELWWLLLGGVALAGVIFGLLLLCAYPFQKRLARYLDDSLGGGEKVQTMVEFASSNDVMAGLQRKDAEERLAKAPKSVTKLKHAWQCIAAACLGLATLTAALVVPAKAESDPSGGGNNGPTAVTTPFEASEYILTALRELIEEVKKSSMEQPLRAKVVAELEKLLADVSEVTTREEMVQIVKATMEAVDKAVEDVNTGLELATALAKTDNSALIKLANAVGATDMARFNQTYLEFGMLFKDVETAADEISDVSLKLTIALAMSQVSETDDLYLAIKALNETLVAQVPNLQDGSYGQTTWENQLDTMIGDCTAAFSEAMGQQITNDEVRDYVIRKLQEIFGLKNNELPALSADYTPTTGGDGDKDDDSNLSDGGLGTGDLNFASNELVYDPETGKLVPYIEVFERYYAIYIAAVSEGKVDANLEKILQTYFDKLAESDHNKS